MKKPLLFFYLLIALVNISHAQTFGQRFVQAVQNGDINFIKNIVKDHPYILRYSYLDFTKNDLRLFRNTIYAIHGYKFKSKDLQEHFRQFDWYNGTKDNVEDEFIDYERFHIQIITQIEANYPSDIPEGLTGHWINPVQASVETEAFLHIWVNPNGIIIVDDDYFRLWSLNGADFQTESLFHLRDEPNIWWMNDGGNKNFKIENGDQYGKKYKWCDFFNSDVWFKAEDNPIKIFPAGNPFR